MSNIHYDPDPQNARYILCPNCGGEVYRYDRMYLHDNEYCCEHCIKDYAIKQIKEISDEEVIDIFQMREILPREFIESVIVRD